MNIQLTFKPTLKLLASILMCADQNKNLPINISKAWIDSEFKNLFWLYGAGALDINCALTRYFEQARKLNDKYQLDLEEGEV